MVSILVFFHKIFGYSKNGQKINVQNDKIKILFIFEKQDFSLHMKGKNLATFSENLKKLPSECSILVFKLFCK